MAPRSGGRRPRRAVLAVAMLALLGAVAPPSPSPGGELDLPAVEHVTLDNGLRVFAVEYRGLPIFDFTLLIGTGAVHDPADRAGLASFVAGALRRGTDAHDAREFAEAVESLGGDVDAGVDHDSTVITARFLARDAGTGLDLVAAMVRRPAFDRGEIKRERAEVLAALQARYEDPSEVASLCYESFLYGAHPYGRPVEGNATSVGRISRNDVRSFHARNYRPNNAIAVAIGDMATGELVAQVRRAFGSWEAGAPPPPPPPAPAPVAQRRILLVDDPGATQAQIRLGNVSIARSDPDYVTARVVNTVLGGGFSSRLVEELRVKHSLTYGAWSDFVAQRVGGDFRIGTFTKVSTTVTALRMTLNELDRFRAEPPTVPELDKARNYLRGQFPFRLQAPSAFAAHVAENEFLGLGLQELTTFRSRVGNVQADGAAEFVRRHVPASGSVAVVVVAPAAKVSGALGSLGPVEITTPKACVASK